MASGFTKLFVGFDILSGPTTTIILTILTLLIIFLLYIYILFNSSRWLLKWYGAHKILKDEKPLLYSILEELSKKSGIKTPEILSFESKIPAMFTVGSGIRSFIAISTSMLEVLNELELEALVAHEIGHIKNRDIGLNTVTAFLAGLLMSIPKYVMWGSVLLGFGQPEDPAPKFFEFIATAFVAPPAIIIIQLTNPKKREFAADETSIKLAGNPRTLAQTLIYLENYISLQPVNNKFNPGHYHLFNTHTQQIRGNASLFVHLFDTHPGIEERVTHILKLPNNVEENTLNSKYSIVPDFFDLRSWKLAMASSLFAYILILLAIIVILIFGLKGAHNPIIMIVCVLLVGVFLSILGITSIVSRRGHRLK